MIVYVNHQDKKRWEKITPPVFGAFSAASMGRVYPKAVVSSTDQIHVFANMNHKQLEKTSEYSKVGKVTKEALQGKLAEPGPVFELHWAVKNSEGGLKGSFVKLVDNKRLFLKIKGKEYGNKLEEFGEGAQRYAKYLAGSKSETSVSKDNKDEDISKVVETWESSTKNKTIQASFISLDGDSISLKLESGKVVTFSMNKLNEKSQRRARELRAP